MAGQKLKGVRRWVFTQEYRFRLGQSMLVFVNFSLLVVAASSKLEWITGVQRTRHLLIILVPLAFVCVWVLGFLMDRVVKAPEVQSDISADRSPYIQEILDSLERIEEATRGQNDKNKRRRRRWRVPAIRRYE